MCEKTSTISIGNRFLKRSFDVSISFIGLILTCWIILISFILATISTRKTGFFVQNRVGKNGTIFKVIKIRTMKDVPNYKTTITSKKDPRITKLGSFFRKSKIDELPQLINVFLGKMSFVGPRPDVPGFADQLNEQDRIIMTIRPGITGPATLKYRNEEELLSEVFNPEQFNQDVIFPDKVRINKEYIATYSFIKDIKYILITILGDNLFSNSTLHEDSNIMTQHVRRYKNEKY